MGLVRRGVSAHYHRIFVIRLSTRISFVLPESYMPLSSNDVTKTQLLLNTAVERNRVHSHSERTFFRFKCRRLAVSHILRPYFSNQ